MSRGSVIAEPRGLRSILTARPEQIRARAIGWCAAHGADGGWWMRPAAPGAPPVLLCAHVDTVWDDAGPADPLLAREDPFGWGSDDMLCSHESPRERTWCRSRIGIWLSGTPGIGIGADDRAGVWACLELRRRTGCAVLLLDGEERGAHGAREAAQSVDPCAHDWLAILEIDRRGYLEAVAYHPVPDAIWRAATQAGFRRAHGTFSDISVLGPAWHLPALNLSAGYYAEHTPRETLDEMDLLASVDAAEKLIRLLAGTQERGDDEAH